MTSALLGNHPPTTLMELTNVVQPCPFSRLFSWRGGSNVSVSSVPGASRRRLMPHSLAIEPEGKVPFSPSHSPLSFPVFLFFFVNRERGK